MNERNRTRIERLRNAAVEPFISYDEFYSISTGDMQKTRSWAFGKRDMQMRTGMPMRIPRRILARMSSGRKGTD